jgi:hypothetical protein
LIVHVAEELPAGIMTDTGIDAMAELPPTMLSAAITSAGAGAFRETLPVVARPPSTRLGEIVTLDGTGGVRVTRLDVL